MLAISRVLGQLITKHVRTASSGEHDCRLLLPGLTRSIAREIHDYLLQQGISSYLVVGEEEQPSEEKRLIRAVGLTSKRIGSFVAVASPGQLVNIQDSIRGSGGAIRSMAFSEEWPWIDDGEELFRFNGPVLDALVSEWTTDASTQAWLRSLTLDGLVEHTRSSSKRAHVLLEQILGTFNPSEYPGITDIKHKFLYHAGIPLPTGTIPHAANTIRDSVRLSKKIIERCQKDGEVRDQARDMILEVVPENERRDVRKSLDIFLDGMGKSTTIDLGLLAFHDCWGTRNAPGNWTSLHATRLAALFGVKEAQGITVAVCDLHCERKVVSDDRKKLATFVGEQVELDIDYKISPDQFTSGAWFARVLNRQKMIVQQELHETEGHVSLQFNTADIPNHSRKAPLRIAFFLNDESQADTRMDLHLCGQDRPAFAIIEPAFEVVDATATGNEDTSDNKVIVDDPVHVFLFSHTGSDVSLSDENEVDIGLIGTGMTNIWRTAQKLDVAAIPSGQATLTCKFGQTNSVICFEASNQEKGEFTVEDELRVILAGGTAREKYLNTLLAMFRGESREPYTALGGISETSRRRMVLSKIASTRTGWRPLLANLLAQDNNQVSGSLGDFINHLGTVEEGALAALTMPPQAILLLKAYADAREGVIREIESNLDTRPASFEHPTYATNPIYIHQRSSGIEALLSKYLAAYHDILAYIQVAKKELEWGQFFILTHLDSVVHWDKTRLRGAFSLLGPWHPLVLAKRFMVQAALFERAHRLRNGKDSSFRHLSVLLGRVQGFRWLVGLSADDRQVEPTFVVTTSDPGWHVVFKTTCSTLATLEGMDGLTGISTILRRNLGLSIETSTGGAQNLALTTLSSYMRAFPSRRSIGVRIRRGYCGEEIVKNVNAFLHAEEGPTDLGKQLPGGVRLYMEDSVEGNVEAQWSNPPLCIYKYEDDNDCVQKTHPDMYLLPPVDEVAFKRDGARHVLPRGANRQVIFSEPLRWLTEGQTLVPKSITYEFDSTRNMVPGFGGEFTRLMSKITEVLGESITTVSSIDLPQRLTAPWVVIPGQSIDPAILVKYVRDGADRALQERALWDYKLDLVGRASSFFILSTIPRGFQVAVNSFFGQDDDAGNLVVELGKIGIAIGGEALKTGRHALGIIGLVGAVRLMVGTSEDGDTPLPRKIGAVSFLIPVDSFASFFGKNHESDGKRTDLLAISLALPGHGSDKLSISACGVESKFVSGTLGISRAHAALAQGLATTGELKNLVTSSLKPGAMPERLALIELLKFGLRITSPSNPGEGEDWVDTESSVYQAILEGNYRYQDAKHAAVLVSTEGNLPGVSEHVILPEGLWARLTKKHWPGLAETPQLQGIRKALCKIFETSVNIQAPLPAIVAIPLTTASGTDKTGTGLATTGSTIGTPPPVTPVASLANSEHAQAKIAVQQETGTSLQKIPIGVDESRQMVYFDPQSQVDPLDNMNVMVTGSSGTGKTQFLKYLICKLREQGKNTLVLDLKNDFISDGPFCDRAGLERLSVAFDGLPFNPLIPYPVRHPVTGDLFIQCSQHIAGVSSVLKQTYGLGAQQQSAVKNAIVAAFTSTGISTTSSMPFTDNLQFPDFSGVGEAIQRDNPLAYNRLDPLFTLNLFRQEFQGQSFHSLVNRSVILDLSQVPSDEIKNALAQLVVLSAHAYYNTQPHSGTIRQFLVFDEGHRVLTADYMPRLVRECRAYGVGTILSSQYPSDFPVEISASMATKVLHGNSRDVERVKAIVQMLGCEGREGDVANLERFQAFTDNRHCPHTLLRTMNYPVYLVWAKLLELGTATREELSHITGLDPAKLPLGNILHQLELLGLSEERDGRIRLL